MPIKQMARRLAQRVSNVLYAPLRQEIASARNLLEDSHAQVGQLAARLDDLRCRSEGAARLAPEVLASLARVDARFDGFSAQLDDLRSRSDEASRPASELLAALEQFSARFDALSAQIHRVSNQSGKLAYQLDIQQMLIARLLADRRPTEEISSLHDAEFQVFSQFGDDGIIQHLVRTLRPETKTFIEFGVSDYFESNTRFLLQHDGWRGLVMDGSDENVRRLKSSYFFWQHELVAKSAFITAENVNELIGSEGFTGDIGLLHIDVDGNDYWIWKALNVVSPRIAIIEYNSVLGPDRSIVMPYNPAFERFRSHYSGLYAGASLAALCDLADEKGYRFIGSNRAGNNAYFLRQDSLGPFTPLSARDGYVESKFRESRDETGRLSHAAGAARLKLIKGLPIFNTRTGETEPI